MKETEIGSLDSESLGPMTAPEGTEFVALEDLDPETDDSELQQTRATSPGSDSPGDSAVLTQEELYEGLSSERSPSAKINKNEAVSKD